MVDVSFRTSNYWIDLDTSNGVRQAKCGQCKFSSSCSTQHFEQLHQIGMVGLFYLLIERDVSLLMRSLSYWMNPFRHWIRRFVRRSLVCSRTCSGNSSQHMSSLLTMNVVPYMYCWAQVSCQIWEPLVDSRHRSLLGKEFIHAPSTVMRQLLGPSSSSMNAG